VRGGEHREWCSRSQILVLVCYNWYWEPSILADPPELVLRPQYKTRGQRQVEAMEKNISDLTTILQSLQAQNESIKLALEDNTAAVRDLTVWKPQMEATVGSLRRDVGRLSETVDTLVAFRDQVHPAFKVFDKKSQDSSTVSLANLDANLQHHQGGFSGLHTGIPNRSDGFGVVTTLTPPPVTGITSVPPLGSPVHSPMHIVGRGGEQLMSPYYSQLVTNLPQLNFPQFDGHHPKMWKAKSESYFEVFSTPPELWVKIATLHFTGLTPFWLQSVGPHIRLTTWHEFCIAVCARFERDHHNQLIRQFFHIKQIDTVTEYVEHFDSLMHQILAHDPSFSVSAIVNRFIDGLKQDIKAVVFIHRPLDLDSAVSLALLQEELVTLSGKPLLSSTMSPSSLPMPRSEVRRTTESYKSNSDTSKAAALMAYRKAKGLCYKCGLHWGPTHKCSPTVSLHVVEELWQVLENFVPVDSSSSPPDDSSEDLMTLSVHAVFGTEAPQTIKILATVLNKRAIMLVDSGGSASFISEQMVRGVSSLVPLAQPVPIRVASGQLIYCTQELSQCKVSVQGHTFMINLKVLPLQCYDAILGVDWLASNSPMEFHWVDNWLAFTVNNSRVVLYGHKSDFSSCDTISASQLNHLLSLDEVWCLLELQHISDDDNTQTIQVDIQNLITEFASLFDKPTGLPLARSHCHSIPLVPGATSFRLRPYRYNPAQKDEIERQVKELLQNGMIQPSSSPFASPVILARKKTGDWRLCVDYRRLNALTVKNKYPLPIIDELLDELQGAMWFTSLDLSSGYHQIQMEPLDIPKTAFQTHNGHYEYRVMPYGVTGGPATFQLTMNSILAPLLRKCVVVFIDDILVYSTNWRDHLEHIRVVFNILDKHQFKVNLSKCSFAQTSLHYLGHIISQEGVATDPEKISAVKSWPTSRSVKDIRSFLGLAGYYRKFVKKLWHYELPSHLSPKKRPIVCLDRGP
jgi:hypothetical protein